MRRLNNLRVGLKHHGTLPSKQDAIQSHEDVSKFLLAATGIVFGLDFGRLDLVDLVSQATAAVAIRQADAAAPDRIGAGARPDGLFRAGPGCGWAWKARRIFPVCR